MTTFSVRILIYICTINYVHCDIADYVKDVCGGIGTCFSRSNNSLTSDSCCRPCECDDICLEKGTCCGDKETLLENPGKVIKQACLPSIKYSSISGDRSGIQSYYVRAACPENYSDRQTRNKCETDEPESLEDIPFVSSNNGKIVYKNRHCAACHGEVDVIAWELLIDRFCIKEVFFDNHNASFLADKLIKSCSLPFIRPNITQWKYTVCHEEEDLISSCPKVNLQDNIIKELQEMCANDKRTLTVYAENNVYANVYCYLCNTDSRPTCDLDIPKLKFLPSISFILNITPITDNQPDAELKEGACDQQEFYDIFFETCRRIRCPQFEVWSQGKCAALVESSKLNYVFNFVLIPEATQRLKTEADLRHFAEALINLITSKLGLESCLICSVEVRSKSRDIPTESVTSFYLEIVYTTSPHCKRELLLSTAAMLEDEEKANKRLIIVTKTVPVHIEYIWSDVLFEKLKKNSKPAYIFSRCKHSDPSKFMNCPKVTLTVEEYQTVVNKSHLTNLQGARSNQGFEVCLDEYKTSINAETSNGKLTRISSYLLLSCMIFKLVSVSMMV